MIMIGIQCCSSPIKQTKFTKLILKIIFIALTTGGNTFDSFNRFEFIIQHRSETYKNEEHCIINHERLLVIYLYDFPFKLFRIITILNYYCSFEGFHLQKKKKIVMSNNNIMSRIINLMKIKNMVSNKMKAKFHIISLTNIILTKENYILLIYINL